MRTHIVTVFAVAAACAAVAGGCGKAPGQAAEPGQSQNAAANPGGSSPTTSPAPGSGATEGGGMQQGGSATSAGAGAAQSPGSQEMQTAAENFGRGLEGLARGFQQMAAGSNGQRKVVEPVSFRELEAALGDISGWKKGRPTGERMTSPVTYSEAKVTYTNGDAELDAQISDSAFNQLILAPAAMMLNSGYEKETDSGYEKATKIDGNPALEKWNGEDKSGELTVLVNNRFIVQLEGRNLRDAGVLHSAAGAIDLKKLASLK